MNNKLQQSSFLPDFCGIRILFVVILIAELLAIMISLTVSTSLPYFTSNLAIFSLFIQWIALVSAATLCAMRQYLNNMSDYLAATVSYTLVMLVSIIISEAAWVITDYFPQILELSRPSHSAYITKCIVISAIVNALILRYFYIQNQWRHNIESETKSRIQALTSRIRPHFLFNCMNTIASLTRKDPKLAEEAIEDLADLFRASLKESRTLANIEDELEICHRYVRIESHRLGERLKVDWQTDQLPKDARIPYLSIQPLLENAIYHGIEILPEGGIIHVSGEIKSNRIIIRLDNPVPVNLQSEHHEGNQVALDNLQQRLFACFGNQSQLNHYMDQNRYYAEIIIPVKNEDINS